MSLKNKFLEAYAQSKTMNNEEKEFNMLIQKTLLKKSIPWLILIAIMPLISIPLNINIWALIGLEIALGIFTLVKMRKDSKQINNFTYHQGNILSIHTDGKHTTIILKEGKLPIKIELNSNIKSISKLKKNQFVKLNYNKNEKICNIIK